MTIGRRDLLALPLAAALAPATARAQLAEPARFAWPPADSFRLWPGRPPGAPIASAIMRGTAIPDVGVYRPARPDGRAALVLPGGGYGFVSLENEGAEVAQVLAAEGITAFVLDYRLPGDGWRDRANTPLADAQRAMRLIRANARRFGIDPARLGVLGFSAGGHLAGALVTLHATRVYVPVDAADRESAAPAFGGLIYAVSNMTLGRSFGGSRANLLGPQPDPAMVERYGIDRHLAGAPPLFLVAAEDDPTVPVVNTLDLLAAARAARISTEAHVFRRGGHGFGTRLPRSYPASLWPDLFIRWTGELFTRTAA